LPFKPNRPSILKRIKARKNAQIYIYHLKKNFKKYPTYCGEGEMREKKDK